MNGPVVVTLAERLAGEIADAILAGELAPGARLAGEITVGERAFIGTGAAVVDGIKALRTAGVTGQIVTLSNNASGGFVKALGEQARGVVVTQVFPSERSLNYAVIKEAMDLARVQNIADLTPAMVEGFVSAKVLVEGLKRAGPKPDRAKLHAGLEGIRNWDMGGLTLESFSYSLVSGEGGDPEYFISVIEDIQSRRELEEQLIRVYIDGELALSAADLDRPLEGGAVPP